MDIGMPTILGVALFLLGCYGLAIGLLQALGFVRVEISLNFRFLGASGVGNVVAGLAAVVMGVAMVLHSRLGGPVTIGAVAVGIALAWSALLLSEYRRRRLLRSQR